MNKDTTPILGDEWARDGESRTVVVVDNRVKFWMVLHPCALMQWCSIHEWHAWAANARKVG